LEVELLDKFFHFNFKSSWTEAELAYYAKSDVVSINSSMISEYNPTPDAISRLRSMNGSIKLLYGLNLGTVFRSGGGPFAGPTTGTFPDNKPYAVPEYHYSYRTYSENQVVLSSSGTVLDTIYGGTGYSVPDFTKYCPTGADGLTLREWMIDYLVTGVYQKYDVDGFVFDETHDDHVNYMHITNDVDIERDGVESTAAARLTSWSGGIHALLSGLRSRLDSIGETGAIIAYNGNSSAYTFADQIYLEDYPNRFLGKDWWQSFDFIQNLINSGTQAIINLFTNNYSGTSTTGIIDGPEALQKEVRYYTGTSYMFTGEIAPHGCLMHSDSQLVTHDNAWFPSAYKRFETALTKPLTTGDIMYRLFKEGVAIINTGTTTQSFYGMDILPSDGMLVPTDTDRDFLTGDDGLQHGFGGIKGVGLGNHLNHSQENISSMMMNKMELAVHNLHQSMQDDFGPFEFRQGEELKMQYVYSDGTGTKYSLSKGVDRWSVESLNWTGERNASFGQLADINGDTRLYHALEFSSAPTTGYYFVFYRTNRTSAFNSSAYLETG